MSAPTTRVDDDIIRKVLHAILPVPEGIYAPREDSFLILDVLSAFPVQKKEVLDVGTGSGVLGLYCAMRGAKVTITDEDEEALRYAQKAAQTLGLNLSALVSDLFSNIAGQFDLVVFNPPYLPSIGREDRTIDGGDAGAILSRKFLEDLGKHLKADGFALLLVSSLNNLSSLIAEHSEYAFSVLAKRDLFFEELQVLSLKFRGKTIR
jgi:release factor glutamine methyltransferase